MPSRNRRIATFFAAAVVMLACAPAVALPSAAPATFDPNSIKTAIVLTASAAARQTALVVSPTFTPSPTSLPSSTPSIPPTATVTFVFILHTATKQSPTAIPGTSGLKFDCNIVSKTPPDDSHIPPNADFQMDWRVYNSGTSVWDADNTDYRYRAGDKLHKQNIYDLPSTVPSGGQIDLTVAMKTPANSGTYSTTWIIKDGPDDFCRMSVTIHVP